MTSLNVKATEGTEFYPCNATITFGDAGHPLRCIRPCGHSDTHNAHLVNYPVSVDGFQLGRTSVTADIEWKINKHDSAER